MSGGKSREPGPFDSRVCLSQVLGLVLKTFQAFVSRDSQSSCLQSFNESGSEGALRRCADMSPPSLKGWVRVRTSQGPLKRALMVLNSGIWGMVHVGVSENYGYLVLGSS